MHTLFRKRVSFAMLLMKGFPSAGKRGCFQEVLLPCRQPWAPGGREPSPQGLGEGATQRVKEELGETSVVGLGDAEGSQFWSVAVRWRQNVERDVHGGFQ